MIEPGEGGRRLLALADRAKLEAVLPRLLDPINSSPTSACGRSRGGWPMSPILCDGNRVAYEPAESSSPIYGGNSNWRGPIWFPVNYLMVEALREYHRYYGSNLTVEMPRGGPRHVDARPGRRRDRPTPREIFLRDPAGRRPVFGDVRRCSRPIPTGGTISPSMSTSTATTARGWGPATRPAGPPWSPS